MNAIIPLFIITGIIFSRYLKKEKMIIAKSTYLITFTILLLILPFITGNKTLIYIIKIFMVKEYYYFISSALYNIEYVFCYFSIMSLLTLIQIVIIVLYIQKKIKLKLKRCNKIKEIKKQKEEETFSENKIDNNLSLDRVFIDYCRMMN